MGLVEAHGKNREKGADEESKNRPIEVNWADEEATQEFCQRFLPADKLWAYSKDASEATCRERGREYASVGPGGGAYRVAGIGEKTFAIRRGAEWVDPWEESKANSMRIESLYEAIAHLLERKRELEREIDRRVAKLRALQQQEAEKMREAFEERLDMPLDAGRKAVERAEELLSRYEDSSGED